MNEVEGTPRDGNHNLSLAENIEQAWLELVRLYTFNTPISKGKYRLFQFALGLVSKRPRRLLTKVRDGRRFIVDFTTGMQETVFFIGEYEPFITEVIRPLVDKGATCVDAGANFGWYTTLMSVTAGESGVVHAFEPMPSSFAELSTNCAMLPNPNNVHINNVALGDREDVVRINLFDNEPSGHASLAAKGEAGSTAFDCRMITLDHYLAENEVGDVSLMKVDIEGAEMMLLKGSSSLFAQQVPPVILMEMALEQSRHFGYKPDNLIQYIGSRAEYSFYKIDEVAKRLIRIEGFEDDDIGANVLCFPENADDRKKRAVEGFAR